MPDKESWLNTFIGEMEEEEDLTLDQLMKVIEETPDELDERVRGKLRKDQDIQITVRFDKRDVAQMNKIMEYRLDPRYPSRAHAIRYGLRLVLKEIWDDNKTHKFAAMARRDLARRELEEAAELQRDAHDFFSRLRENATACFDDPEAMEEIRKVALVYYASGITTRQKEQLRIVFPNILGD